MDKKVLRYEGFVRKINENQPAIKEVQPAPTTTPAPTAPPMPSIVPKERPSEEDEPMARTQDLSMNQPATMASLDDLHGMFADDQQHGAELIYGDNILKYRGIEVEIPSETGSYMVGGKNLKTKDAQKAYNYVQAQVKAQVKAQDAEEQAYEGQNELVESKSYSKTRKFEKRTKK